jgi:hypothetical protein
MRIECSGKQSPVVRKNGAKMELIVPVEFVDKKGAVVQTIDW